MTKINHEMSSALKCYIRRQEIETTMKNAKETIRKENERYRSLAQQKAQIQKEIDSCMDRVINSDAKLVKKNPLAR